MTYATLHETIYLSVWLVPAAAGKLLLVLNIKLDQILMRISNALAYVGELLNAAYERVINPIFMDNPEFPGVMSTANSLKLAYS